MALRVTRRLLSESVATLSAAGVIDLDEVVQDGVRVRASAGAGSFRRKKKLHKELNKAKRLIEQLKQEANDDPDASNRRIRAARERAADERAARVAAALDKLAEIEAERVRRAKTNKKQTAKQKEPRASTTDPQARIMKMADGGYRPAYNCHTTAGEGRSRRKFHASDACRACARPQLAAGASCRRKRPGR